LASSRLLSHTEIETAQTCFARHAFRYTGHLTGGQTLKSRAIPTRLSEGRAWGVAVARWHAGGKTLLAGLEAAEGLRASLDSDEQWMAANGYEVGAEQRVGAEDRLQSMLRHYIQTAEPLGNLSRTEAEIAVALRSRTGQRHSTRYGFQAFIDGWTYDEDDRPWLVEFKLRGRLSSVDLIAKSRQLRWSAWGLREAKGIEPVGVLVDERWAEPPHFPRLVQAKRKGDGIDGYVPSHARDQLCTAEQYAYVCRYYGVEPNRLTSEALEQRRWQQRVPILFRQGELDEAGRELVSAAKLIRDLDSGALYPIRHALASTCGGCQFQSICPNPSDELYVDTLFVRTAPKRLRPQLEEVIGDGAQAA
jgi:hypothetical protein